MTAPASTCCAAPDYHVESGYTVCSHCGNAKMITNEGHCLLVEPINDVSKIPAVKRMAVHDFLEKQAATKTS